MPVKLGEGVGNVCLISAALVLKLPSPSITPFLGPSTQRSYNSWVSGDKNTGVVSHSLLH